MIALGLGTNMGDREINLERALQLLNGQPGIEVNSISSIYETAPFGVTDQADFLNLTVTLFTSLTPQALLKACLTVEQTMGRVRTRRWGPRVIDIDILLYNDIKVATPELTLPHPGILQREFVVIPLKEMAPELILPDGRTAATVATDFSPKTGNVRLWKHVTWDAALKRFR